MNVAFGLVIDPVEPGLHGQTGQHGVLAAVAVRGGDVNRSALVMQGLFGMMSVLVPALRDPETHARPQVHHRDGQRVKLVLTTLQDANTKYKVTEAVLTKTSFFPTNY